MASGFGNTSAHGNKTPAVKSFFEITDDPLANEKYAVIEPLRAKIDHELTAAVRRLSDGRSFLRVFYPGMHYSGPGYYHGPGLLRQKLEIIQKLRHSNIVKIEEAVITEDDNAIVYQEMADLGEITKFAETNEIGEGRTEKIPIAFAWHVLSQGLRAICYLTYGYHRMKDVIASSDAAPGWDPVVHTRIFDGSKSRLYLKTSGKGKYPTVVLRGFDECRQESEFLRYSSLAPQKALAAFADEQSNDLYQFIRFMYHFLISFDPIEAAPIRSLLQTFHLGSPIPPNAEYVLADARQMARDLEEAFSEHKVVQEDFSGPLRQPAYTNALVLAGDLAPWKRAQHAVHDEDLQKEISPAGMKFPKSGTITPAYGYNLKRLENSNNASRKISSTLANTYLVEQLNVDREAARRSYPLDKILRDTAKSEYAAAHPWKMTGLLGKGGFGSVTRWSRRIPDPKNRGKLISQKLAIKDSDVTYNFGRDYNAEFYLTRRLNKRSCKNVVKVYDHAIYRPDTASFSQRFRMALEYCKYGSLADLIRFYMLMGLALPEPFVWQVVLQIASSLACCENGRVKDRKAADWDTIIHLDLKPQNVLLHRDENSKLKYPDAKLADFGLACVLPNDEVRSFKSTHNVGTKGYKDPALADGKPMSTKADIYSFGKMVKMMVETFYDIRHDYEVVINYHTKDLKHPVEKYYPCKKTLIDLVHKCCNRDPNVRPTAHEIFRLAHTELNSAYMMRLRKSSRSIVLTGERRKDMWVEKRAFQGLRKKKEWYTKNKELCHEVVRLVWKVKPSVRAPPINP